ncbi:DUF2306 domain-containing protein [Psychromicrobium xiongbiense]|uniref:DUF2306 domain-containing protein n=1 Tax=Psychromicrobium xiongbiense TaxID=3051184 RepID=UPI0025527B9B|nr:DUF2306 domain-containing protein [Psychromicrobium sp. YIM S02556]
MPLWTPLIILHAVAATVALMIGAVQLFRRKGDRPHRTLGRIWVIFMAIALLTSFGILTITGGFGILHGLSVFTACTITIGVIQARRAKIPSHRAFMIGSYFGLLGALIGVVAVPTRRIPTLAVHEPLLLVLFLAILALATAATVIGIVRFRRP